VKFEYVVEKLRVLLVFAVLAMLFGQQYQLCILKSHVELAACFVLVYPALPLATFFHLPMLV